MRASFLTFDLSSCREITQWDGGLGQIRRWNLFITVVKHIHPQAAGSERETSWGFESSVFPDSRGRPLHRTSGSATRRLLPPAGRRRCRRTPGQRCTELSERREVGGRRTCTSGRRQGRAQASACSGQRNAPTWSPAHWGFLHRSHRVPVKMVERTSVIS